MGTFFRLLSAWANFSACYTLAEKKGWKFNVLYIFGSPFLFCQIYIYQLCKKSSKIKAIFRSSPPKIIGGYNFKAWTWVSITKWQSTLQMFTGIYRDSAGVFCNICREKPVIFTDCREIPADIAGFPCRYCRKNLNHPVNPCKHLQCRIKCS